MAKRKISVASPEDIVFLPGIGEITVRELIARIERERELRDQEKRRNLVDERKMLYLLSGWLYDTYAERVYFYSPAKHCRPDLYGIKDRCVDFYELKAYYMTWEKSTLHDIPMQNIEYEHNFLRAYCDGRLEMPEDVEKYTFNYLITPETYERVKSTRISLIKEDLCLSLIEELGYGVFILHSRDQCAEKISPKVLNLNKESVQERLQTLNPYVKEIGSLKST